MKNLTITFLILILAISTAMSQRIKFATLAPEGSTYYVVMDEFNKEIQELTEGEVKFKIYAGGIQGEEKDVVRKFRFNQIHAAGLTGVGLGEILPEIRVLELPLLFHNYDEVDHVTEALYDEFSAKFEEKGYVILGWADVGFANVFSKKPIITLEDLRSTKMWMWEGDPLAEATFKALSVNAVPLAILDVPTSLQTGILEAVYIPALPCVSLQWYTRINTMMDLPLANVSGAVLISKKQFDKLDPAHQKIMKEKGREHMARLVKLAREDNEKSIELMKANGLQITEVPADQLEIFSQAARAAYEDLAGNLYPKELLERVESTLAEYRESHAQN